VELVKPAAKSFSDYHGFMEAETVAEIEGLVKKLSRKKVAMINATSYGGGVAEVLHSLVPLVQDMGLELDWWVMEGSTDFYHITKSFHNRLQGQEGHLKEKDKEVYLETNRRNAELMKDWDYDIIVVHDPQPAALICYYQGEKKPYWVWRCHIDTSTPNEEYWDFIYSFVKKYQACVFTMPDYVKRDTVLHNLTFISPSIDPLSEKNRLMELDEALEIVSRFGVDVERPLVSQVSRFDPWKDPLGVIEAYKLVKKEFPSVQLVLVGSMASDDPEGWDYLYYTLRRAGEDYDIKIVTNFNGITGREVNAFQTASDLVLQKSIREGFGLTVAEAMWKGTPVIGGAVGGIRLQIDEGINGYLVDSVEECAQKMLHILRNPELSRQMAETGKEKVRREFLVNKNALDYLRLFHRLTGQGYTGE